MRVRLVVLSLVLTCWAGTAQGAEGPLYMVALGDSLAVGIQPINGAFVPTNVGYVDDLHAFYRARFPGLRLKKFGCSGETTSSLITGIGSTCSHPTGSQLTDAVQFIQTHRVGLVTIDIGADDLLGCFSVSTGIDSACVNHLLFDNVIVNDLSYILHALRDAAGPNVLIVGMNYYDPLLAAWVFGPQGQALAAASLPITQAFNALLEGTYQLFNVPVADVERAFRTTNTTPVLGIPTNVLLALLWTWMGAPPPAGPDVHPNITGYAVIAGAFVRAIEEP
jgi:lysophospholipase L1-like esterase